MNTVREQWIPPLRPGAERLFVASWELECCGEPVRVGDDVRFATEARSDTALIDLFGGPARSITRTITWHSLTGAPAAQVSGVVVGLMLARVTMYEVAPRSFAPRLGSGTLEVIGRTEHWECAETEAPERWGWFVDISPTRAG